MRTLYVAVIILIAGIVLPAIFVASTSLRAEANPPSVAQSATPTNGLPVTTLAPAVTSRTTMIVEPSRSDASRLLDLELDLKLKPAQIQRLNEIIIESSQKASAVLTQEQQKSLTSLTESARKPISIGAVE